MLLFQGVNRELKIRIRTYIHTYVHTFHIQEQQHLFKPHVTVSDSVDLRTWYYIVWRVSPYFLPAVIITPYRSGQEVGDRK